MKILRIFLVMFLLSVILSGCVNQEKQKIKDTANNQGSEIVTPSSQQNVSSTADTSNDNKEMIKIVNNDYIFVQNNAYGSELWFDKWHFYNSSSDENFVINEIKYTSGLGYDGNTIEGPDKTGFSFIEYRIASGKYDEITGIFGFDDKTEAKPSSKLLIYVDNSVIYESEPINEDKKSIEVKVPINKDAKTIGFKIETEIKSDIIPKIVFADIKLQKIE